MAGGVLVLLQVLLLLGGATANSCNMTRLLKHLSTEQVVFHWDEGYEVARQQYFSLRPLEQPAVLRPSVVVFAKSVRDVRKTLRFARECGFDVNTRSGGHQYAGLSSCHADRPQCIQLDMSSFTKFKVRRAVEDGVAVSIGPGLRLGDLYQKLGEKGLFLPAGICPTVAAGGHLQTGGIGMLVQNVGLAVDHVLQYKVVLSSGRVVRASERENVDLFWALRGGAPGNFGVVTEITVKAHRNRDWPLAYQAVLNYGFAPETHREVMLEFYDMVKSAEYQQSTDTAFQAVMTFDGLSMQFVYSGRTPIGDSPHASRMLQRLKGIGTPVVTEGVVEMIDVLKTSVGLVKRPEGTSAVLPFEFRTHYTGKGYTPEAVHALADMLLALQLDQQYRIFPTGVLASFGGMYHINDHNNKKTAYGARSAVQGIDIWAMYTPETDPQATVRKAMYVRQRFDALWKNASTYFEDEVGLISYLWEAESLDTLRPKYYPDEALFKRLQAVKTQYDPINLFRNRFSLPLIHDDEDDMDDQDENIYERNVL